MEKGENILAVDKALESLYNNKCLKFTKGIENKFDYLLRENDLFYEDKIKFEISKIHSSSYYRIKIIPAKDEFNSGKYFSSNFEKGPGINKLKEFNKENNVAVVTY